MIEALGDYRATYAVGPITEVAKIDGPMQTGRGHRARQDR